MKPLADLIPLAHPLTAAILDSFWEGACLAFLVWLGLRCFRHWNATTRYWIWWGALLAAVALTGLRCVGAFPRSTPRTEMVASQKGPQIQPVEFGSSSHSAALLKPTSAAFNQSRAVPREPAIDGLHVEGRWPWLFLGTWLSLSAAGGLRLFYSWVRLSRVKSRAVPLAEASQQHFQALLERSGITRRIRLGQSGDITIPLAAGLWQPMILIPSTFLEQLNRAELDQICTHEAAHLARWDDWAQLVQQVLLTAFALHPVVWWLSRRLNLERELACDDWVLSTSTEPKSFARCLVKLAELIGGASQPELASGIWGGKGQLSRRIEALLDANRRSTTRISRLACFGAGGTLLAAVWGALTLPTLVSAEPPHQLSSEVQASSSLGTRVVGDALLQVEAKRVGIQARLGEIEEYKRAGKPLAECPAISADEGVQHLQNELAVSEAELAELKKRYKPKHPAYQRLQERVNSLQQSLEERAQSIETGLQAEEVRLRQEKESLDWLITLAMTEERSGRPAQLLKSTSSQTRPDEPASEREAIMDEIRLAEQQVQLAEEGRKHGQTSAEEVLKFKRQLAALKRDLAAYEERKQGRRDLVEEFSPAAPPSDQDRSRAQKLRQEVSASLLGIIRNETNTDLRISALASLLRSDPRGSLDLLTDLVLKDPDPRMRLTALSALASQKNTASANAVLKIYDLLGRGDRQLKLLLIDCMGLSERGQHPAAGERLAIAEKAVAKLQQIAGQDEDPGLRAEAVRQLGRVADTLRSSSLDNGGTGN